MQGGVRAACMWRAYRHGVLKRSRYIGLRDVAGVESTTASKAAASPAGSRSRRGDEGARMYVHMHAGPRPTSLAGPAAPRGAAAAWACVREAVHRMCTMMPGAEEAPSM